MHIDGDCLPAFTRVKDSFAIALEAFPTLGAALSVVHDGNVVVDLWAGHADQARQHPWREDTVVNTTSTGKGLVAALAHLLAERGQLDLDAPVARLWPEFAAEGKEAITTRQLLDHTAGLPAVRTLLPRGTLTDWQQMTAALAAERPFWAPGQRHGYHAVTFGFLVGEVLARASGVDVRTLLAREIAGPWSLDYHIGLPAEDDHRAAEVAPSVPIPGAPSNPFGPLSDEDRHVLLLAFGNPPELREHTIVNDPAWRRAQIPASNGHGNARSLARFYGGLAAGGILDGVRLFQPETLESAARERVRGVDAVLGLPDSFASGFMLPSPMRPFGPPHAFGHPGVGGNLGFADAEAKLGFGFVVNQPLIAGLGGDPRWKSLIDAAYASLG
ncbi:serine hydrolase domain-containing protein [Chondromyces crocatus]|uniref:Esterase n=1 Tax=Chondromyces crocatus TaxID=52 RepID=A0A0K1EE27_CHOCO|nr:serine hydrolase domain-containing protein [Chondromyces crocatus]AKT38838.1 esterase [Chondromyces crocatus]